MATTNKDYADKGWLRPEPQEEPFVIRLMDAVALVAVAIFLMVLVVLALYGVPRALANEPRAGAEWKVFLPLYFRNRDPVNAPRCPRENALGELIDYGIAMQADGAEWLIDCRYSRGVRS